MSVTAVPALICVFLLFVAGCSLDYSQVSVTEEMSEQIPDSVLHDFTYTVVENGTPIYRLEAEKAEFYTERKETHVEKLVFREYDSDEQLITEGRSDSALFSTDTENAELEGNLRFYTSIEEARFEADYLYWNNAEKILAGSETGRVLIIEDSGSRLEGVGFEADVKRRIVEFSGPVAGTFVAEDDE